MVLHLEAKFLAKIRYKKRYESNNDFPLKDPSDRVREFKREQARVDMHTRVVVRASFCFCFFCFCSIFSSFFSHQKFLEFVIKVEREILIINHVILSRSCLVAFKRI